MRNLLRAFVVGFGIVTAGAFFSLVLPEIDVRPIKQSIAQGVGLLSAGHIWGNSGSSAAPAQDTSIGAVIDQSYTCTAQGSILQRGSSVWSCLGPDGANTPLVSKGASAN